MKTTVMELVNLANGNGAVLQLFVQLDKVVDNLLEKCTNNDLNGDKLAYIYNDLCSRDTIMFITLFKVLSIQDIVDKLEHNKSSDKMSKFFEDWYNLIN